MKTSELTGAALDWAVAKCEGVGLGPKGSIVYYHEGEPAMWNPSTDWSQGGPIIEREGICPDLMLNGEWVAASRKVEDTPWMSGPTALIAAMRCYVASKLGDTIEIPEELL